MIYYEDVEIGRMNELGSFTFTAEEIKRFAARYDPQPFHIDEAGGGDQHLWRASSPPAGMWRRSG